MCLFFLLPSFPLLLCLLPDFFYHFLHWEKAVALFHLFSSPSPLFISPTLIPPVFHFLLQLSPLIPLEAMGEWGRDSERQDRPALLKTLFTPGTKQHVISALGETLTRVWRGGRVGWLGAKRGKETEKQAGNQKELKSEQECGQISWLMKSQQAVLLTIWGACTNPDWTESQKDYRNIFSVGILQIQGWVKYWCINALQLS